MRKKLDIVIDVDGVLGNFIKDFLLEVNKRNNTNILKEDIIRWDLTSIDGISKKDFDLFEKENYYLNMSLEEKAQEFLEKLYKLNHELYICTATSEKVINGRSKWLQNHFSLIPKNNFIFTKNKKLIKAHVFIDDAFHNLKDNNSNLKLLISQPWNRSYNKTILNRYNIIRVENLEEALEKIKSYKEEI